MDLQIDEYFNLAFTFPGDNPKTDFNIVTSIQEEKQKLYIYLTLPKGNLPYDPNFGLDYETMLQLTRIGNINRLKGFFSEIVKTLKLNVSGVSIDIDNDKLKVYFYFPYDTLSLEYQL